MAMSSIEIKIPEGIKQYVLNDTAEKMRNALLLYFTLVQQTMKSWTDNLHIENLNGNYYEKIEYFNDILYL